MEAKVTWKGQLAFEGSASGVLTVPLNSKAVSSGEGNGFSPMELILVGLASCTAMDVISILEKKRQVVTSFELQAHADRATEHPRVFTHIVLEYIVTGRQVERAAVERAIELSETKYCPALAMFSQVVPIEHPITIFEAETQE